MDVGAVGPANVLVVDSTDSLHRRLKSQISAEKFQTTTAKSAGRALDVLEESEIDAVISAHSLPDLTGIQLVRSIRISYPSLPFILAPNTGSESLAGNAIAAGATGYVSSQDDETTLVRRLNDSLETKPEEDEEDRRYRHLIEMSPAPINVFDERGESIWCNRAVLDLLGLDGREELIGNSIFDVIHPDNLELARTEVEEVIKNKNSTGPTKMKLQQMDGDVRYVSVSTATGSFLGKDVGQAIAIDVTNQEERERQLQVLDRWLRHNIRNEVSVIRGVAENILDDRVSDIKESVSKIRDHATRLARQANKERELIQTLHTTTDTSVSEVNIVSAIDRQVEAGRDAHPNAQISTRFDQEFTAKAHPDIGRAIRELLQNAIEHNDSEPPEVRVETAVSDEGRGIVRVIDNGPGIPQIERDTLLLDEAVDELHHNSGLGLILVYWIVRMSNGTIKFEDNGPRGSTITISLPVTSMSTGRQA